MNSFEKALAGHGQTALRVGAGFAFWPLAASLLTRESPLWQWTALFLVYLLIWRFGPIFLRWLPVFSKPLKQEWARQRQLAKRYDSYQWQKLFWFGTGMLMHSGYSGVLQPTEGQTAIICVVAGVTGMIVWRRGVRPERGQG